MLLHEGREGVVGDDLRRPRPRARVVLEVERVVGAEERLAARVAARRHAARVLAAAALVERVPVGVGRRAPRVAADGAERVFGAEALAAEVEEAEPGRGEEPLERPRRRVVRAVHGADAEPRERAAADDAVGDGGERGAVGVDVAGVELDDFAERGREANDAVAAQPASGSRSRSRFPVARARAVERGRRAARVPVHHEPPRRREPPAEDGAARGVEAAGVEAEAVERGEGRERRVEDLGPEARGAAEVERGRGRGARRGEEPADGRGAVRAEVRRVAEPELAEPRGRGRRRERVAGGREARAFEPVAGEVQRREARLGREGLGEAREARVAEAVARQVEVRERAAVAIEQRRGEARGALGTDVAGEPQGPQRQVPRRAEEAARERRRARRADAAVDAERAPPRRRGCGPWPRRPRGRRTRRGRGA